MHKTEPGMETAQEKKNQCEHLLKHILPRAHEGLPPLPKRPPLPKYGERKLLKETGPSHRGLEH